MSQKRDGAIAGLTEQLVAAREVGNGELAGALEAAIAELAPKAPPKATFFPLPDAGEGLPPWAKVPADTAERPWKFPRNVQVIAIRFPARLTRAPEKGDRTCLLWEISDGEERVALMRAVKDPNRAQTELAKQMIRAVDEHPADWSGLSSPGSVEVFWREIGAKCRTLIVHVYNQLHLMTQAETDDFLENCVAVVSAV